MRSVELVINVNKIGANQCVCVCVISQVVQSDKKRKMMMMIMIQLGLETGICMGLEETG